MLVEVAISVIVVWIVWYVLSTYEQRKRMPPGPFPLPVIGNAHQVGSDPPFSMEGIRKTYGDVYTVSFPGGTFVVVNTSELAREAMITRKDDFAGRPKGAYPLNDIFQGRDVILADYTSCHSFRRRILASALHTFGEGLQLTEDRVDSQVQVLTEWIKEKNEEPFSPLMPLAATMINIITKWLLSTSYDFEDVTMKRIYDFNDKIVLLSRQGSYYQFFPFLKYLPTYFTKCLRDVIQMRDEFFGGHLDYHRETYEKGVIRDITDALLAAYEDEKAKNRGVDVGTIDDVIFLMTDVLVAAADTSTSVLSWFVLYMVIYQDVQERIQRELDRVVGKDRLPCMNDAENLPYLQSTICEVMRHSAFAPILVPHRAIRDSTIKGYHVPKDTIILFNIWRIHYENRDWDEPTLFKPERFLDENEKFVGWSTVQSFFPFGAGRRSCVGNALAKIQLFVAASRLLHAFRLETPKEDPQPNFDCRPAVIRYPNEFNITAKSRL